jgi:hypothetical protein
MVVIALRLLRTRLGIAVARYLWRRRRLALTLMRLLRARVG